MTSVASAHPLPACWFDRSAYRPRVALPGSEGSAWFLAAGAVPRATSVKEAVEDIEARLRGAADAPPRPAPEDVRRAVERSYEAWDLPRAPEAARGIEALGRPETLCVVAGQQPAFLGGPPLVLYKALTAVAAARRIEETTDRPCVPVFWVAGEDHDLEEVREARFPGRDGGEAVFRWPGEAGRRPLDTVATSSEAEAEIERAVAHFEGRRHQDAVRDLARLYRGRTVASGFAAVLAELLGPLGVVIVEPAALRPLAAPLIERVVRDPAGTLARVEEGRRDLRARGVEPFVAGRLPLFLLREDEDSGTRRDHLTVDGGGLAVDGGGPRIGREQALEILTRSPERFSSGALLRPLVQDRVLPAAVTVGGPAEAGYFAQLGPLARWLGVATPRVMLRLQATLLEGRAARAWRRLDLDPDAFAKARRAEDLVPLAERPPFLEAAERLAAEARDLERSLDEEAALDEPSRRRVARGAKKAREATGRLAERVERELRRAREDRFAAARTLWDHVFPGGELQERRLGAFHWLSRYGRQWLDDLLGEARAGLFDLAHRLVVLGEDTDGPDAAGGAPQTGAARQPRSPHSALGP